MTRTTKYLLVLLMVVLPGCKTVMEYRLDECNSAGILQDSSDTENHAARMHGPDNTDGLYASYVFDPEDYVVCAGRRFRGEGYNADPNNTWYGAQYYLQAPDHRDISPLADGEMTLTGWFKTTSSKGTIVCKSGESDNSREYRVFIHEGTLKVTIWNLWGTPFTTDIANNVSDGQWHAFAVTIRELGNSGNIQIKTYLDGSSETDISQSYNSYCQNTSGPLTIGAMYWAHDNITDYFNGVIDEISMTDDVQSREELEEAYQEQLRHRNADGSRRDCPNCASNLHHLEIIHDGSAIACVPEEIKIRACASADCSSLYMDGVTGMLTAGENMTGFSIPAEESETTIQMYMPADSTNEIDPQSITLGLEGLSETPENGYNCSNLSDNSSPCIMSVYKAGFILDIPNLRAGTKYENLEITAVQSSSPDSTVCTPLFESGERKIYFWGQYINPDTGKGKAILIDENSIETINKNAAPDYNNIPQNLTFTNGTATLPPVQYNDVGLMQLNARYLGSEEHEDTGMVVFGSDTFVVKPHHFRIENIKCSDGNGNPGAIDYQGNKFCRAGDDFSVEVSARNAERGITENYGREDSPESINIVSELVQPVGGNAPELSVPSVSVLKNCEGLDADATFCVTTSWPEVGIIKLIPGIGDGDYLGAGDVNEDSIEYVGRFYPHHFELTQGNLINRVESGCTDSVFTYLGENLDFSYTLTAKNALDNPTQNYVEPFHKFSGDDGETPFSGEIYSVNAIHDPSNSAYPLSDRVVIDTLTRSSGWENGTARFTARLSVERGDLPDGPFDDVRFGLYVEDGDGVSIAAPDLDTDADGDADSSQVAPHTQLRYGRLQVANSHGSELLALEGIEIFAEYYDETHEIFRLNSSDSCTSYAAEGINWDSAEYFNGLSQNITATGTGDLDNGRNTFSIHNTADTQAGPGSTGYVVYEFPTHSWLQYDWKGEGDENPSARATFGIFKGNERIIYLRETTWR